MKEALHAHLFDQLVDLLAHVLGDPGFERDLLARAVMTRLFDLPGLQRLERHLALDEFLLEQLVEGAQTVLGLALKDTPSRRIQLSRRCP